MELDRYIKIELPISEQKALVQVYNFVEKFCRANNFGFSDQGENYVIRYSDKMIVTGHYISPKFFSTIFEAKAWIEGLQDRINIDGDVA